jgi:hypothetical protein
VFLTFADGARLANASRHLARDGIVLWSDASAPVITVDDERSYYFEDDAWVVSTDAAFFEVTTGSGILVLFSCSERAAGWSTPRPRSGRAPTGRRSTTPARPR